MKRGEHSAPPTVPRAPELSRTLVNDLRSRAVKLLAVEFLCTVIGVVNGPNSHDQ
jgi:hypothetical protein